MIVIGTDDNGSVGIFHNTVDNASELLLQFFYEKGGIIVTILNLPELLLPDACQLWALQQVCPDSGYQ